MSVCTSPARCCTVSSSRRIAGVPVAWGLSSFPKSAIAVVLLPHQLDQAVELLVGEEVDFQGALAPALLHKPDLRSQRALQLLHHCALLQRGLIARRLALGGPLRLYPPPRPAARKPPLARAPPPPPPP